MLIFLPWFLFGCSWLRPKPKPQPVVLPETCLDRRQISDQTNQLTTWSWDGLFPAMSLATAVPYPEPTNWMIKGEPLLLWDETTGELGVNDNYFSDLQFVDATALSVDTVAIGSLKNTKLSEEELRQLVLFMIDTLVIRTYAHLDADVCLDQETDSAEEYRVHFSVVHRFCTNTCDSAVYDFSVIINKQSGNIFVQPK